MVLLSLALLATVTAHPPLDAPRAEARPFSCRRCSLVADAPAEGFTEYPGTPAAGGRAQEGAAPTSAPLLRDPHEGGVRLLDVAAGGGILAAIDVVGGGLAAGAYVGLIIAGFNFGNGLLAVAGFVLGPAILLGVLIAAPLLLVHAIQWLSPEVPESNRVRAMLASYGTSLLTLGLGVALVSVTAGGSTTGEISAIAGALIFRWLLMSVATSWAWHSTPSVEAQPGVAVTTRFIPDVDRDGREHFRRVASAGLFSF